MALTVTSLGSATGKGVTSVVITLTANVPAGSCIFVAIATAGSVLSNIADSFGQTNWVGGNGLSTASGTILLDWCWNASAMNSGNTITVSPSAGTFTCSAYAWCVTGISAAASPVDATQTASGSGTTPSLTTGSLAQAAEYCVGAIAVAGASTDTFTNDTNYNVLASYRAGTTGGSDITVDVGMRTVMSTSAVTFAPTFGTSRPYAAYLATFKVTDVSVNITGVAGTGSVGSLAPKDSVTLTGVAATGHVGTVTPSSSNISKTLTGAASASAAGTLTPSIPSARVVNLTGVAGVSAAGTFTDKVSAFLTGAASTTHAGKFGDVLLTGVQMQSYAGTLSSIVSLVVSLHGANSPAKAGTIGSLNPVLFRGAASIAAAGDFLDIVHGQGLFMSDLLVEQDPAVLFDTWVSLRWSDDRGMTWSYPIRRTLGEGGEYIRSMLWRRLGMGRDRIFEISFSAPTDAALTGIFYEVDVAQT